MCLIFRFLLPYEKFVKSGEPHPQLLSEDSESSLLNGGGEQQPNGAQDDQEDGADKKPSMSASKETAAGAGNKERKDVKPYLGIKPLQLLTDPAVAAKQQAAAEEEERQQQQQQRPAMKLDDLILFPMAAGAGGSAAGGEETGGGVGSGSALQNLAKIASRYSALQAKDKNRGADFLSPNPKKPRLDEQQRPGVAQPLPPTTAAGSAHAAKKASSVGGGGGGGLMAMQPASSPGLDSSKLSASSLLQQFSLLSPALFGGWGPAALPASGLTSPSSAAAASTGYGSSLSSLDPSKIGQEGYNLLKFYEQQLKAFHQGVVQNSPPPSSQQAAAKLNGIKDSAAGGVANAAGTGGTAAKKESSSNSNSNSKGNKEKQKVSRPPPETKRPPRLLQTPCQFQQTSSIYGSPQSELAKAKETAAKHAAAEAAAAAAERLTEEGGEGEAAPSTTASSTASSACQGLDLSMTGSEYPQTAAPAAPFSLARLTASSSGPTNHSAASLLFRSEPPRPASQEARDRRTPTAGGEAGSLDLSAAAGGGARSATPRSEAPAKISPFSAEALLSRPASSSSANNNNNQRDSPKSFPPLSMGIRGILEGAGNSSSGSNLPATSAHVSLSSPWQPAASKPAAPVPPVVRSSSSMATSSSLLLPPLPATTLSLLPGMSSSTETTFSSLSSLPSSSLQPPAGSAAATNPYLQALMSPFYKPPAPAVAPPAPPPAAAPPGFPGLNPLDPLSQYYAALYSQQLSAYSAAAAAAAMNPYAGLSGAGVSGMSASLGSGSGGGLRNSSYHGGGGGNSNSNTMAAAAEMQALQAYKDMMTRVAMSGPPVSSASAANPYAALYGLMGYPGMSFPTGRKDS